MSKNLLFKGLLVAVFGAALFSCERAELTVEDEVTTQAAKGSVFYAEMEPVGSPDSKTYVNDNYRIRWNAGDKISLFNKITYNSRYRFDGDDGASGGTFSQVNTSETISGKSLPSVYAVFPYDSGTTLDQSGHLTLDLSYVQRYVPNSFGPIANTMVSVTDDDKLMFKNVCGYLVLKLYGSGAIQEISFSGVDNEKISGEATVTASASEDPTIQMAGGSNAYSNINLVFNTPLMLNASPEDYTEIWLVVPPTMFTHGFNVSCHNSGGSVSLKTEKAVAVTRNHITRMSPRKVDMPGMAVPLADIASFADGAKVGFDESFEEVVALAVADEIALVSNAAGDHITLFNIPSNLQRGSKVKWFKGTKNTDAATGVIYVDVSEMGVGNKVDPIPDWDWMHISHSSEYSSIHTRATGLLYQDGTRYCIYTRGGDVILETTTKYDLSNYKDKLVNFYGYTNGWDGDETKAYMILNSIWPITFVETPNWALSYWEMRVDSNGNFSDIIWNEVSSGPEGRYATFGRAYSKDYFSTYLEGSAIKLAEQTGVLVSDMIQAEYSDLNACSIYGSYEVKFDSDIAYGDYVAAVIGVDYDGLPTGYYSMIEYSRTKPPYNYFLGMWKMNGKVITVSEAVNGESYYVSGLVGQESDWTVTARYEDGVFNIYEQIISGTESNGVLLSGIFEPNPGFGYPGGQPDVLFSAYRSNDQNAVIKKGVDSGYDETFTQYSFLTIQGGGIKDNTPRTNVPSSMEVYVPTINYFYQEGFEDEANLADWTFVDADGDGKNWYFLNNPMDSTPKAGDGVLTSASYDTAALTPDNWAFTPAMPFTTADYYLSFWVAAQNPNFTNEHFAVYISTTPTPEDCTLLMETTLLKGKPVETYETLGHVYERFLVPIPAEYYGRTSYIGFRHFDCTDVYRINLDEVGIGIAQ